MHPEGFQSWEIRDSSQGTRFTLSLVSELLSSCIQGGEGKAFGAFLSPFVVVQSER